MSLFILVLIIDCTIIFYEPFFPSDPKPILYRNTGYVILHGDHHGLCDTIGFLKGLVELRALCDPGVDNTHHSRESLAAAALFNWEVFLTYIFRLLIGSSEITEENQV